MVVYELNRRLSLQVVVRVIFESSVDFKLDAGIIANHMGKTRATKEKRRRLEFLRTGRKGKKPIKKQLEGFGDNETSREIVRGIKQVARGNWADVHIPQGTGANKYKYIRYHFGCGYRVYFRVYENSLVVILLATRKGNRQDKDIKSLGKLWDNFIERKEGDSDGKRNIKSRRKQKKRGS